MNPTGIPLNSIKYSFQSSESTFIESAIKTFIPTSFDGHGGSCL